MKIIEIYCVNQGDDDRNFGHPAWFFEDELAAQDAARGKGWYGSNAPITKSKAVQCDDGNVYLLAKDEPIVLNVGPKELDRQKREALAKLTDAEKKLLGIKD